MAKETYYFPHDYYARSDTKMEEMLDDYGGANMKISMAKSVH